MIQSFRLRLALLSAILTGLALVAFGVGSWWLIRGIKLDRMDSELRFYAEREVSRERSADEWQPLESAIAAALGVRDRSNVAILVEDASGTTVYRSPQWPPTLDASRFAWPSSAPMPTRSSEGGSWLSEAHASDSPPSILLAQAGHGPGGGPGQGPGHRPIGDSGPDQTFQRPFPPPRNGPPPDGEGRRYLPPPPLEVGVRATPSPSAVLDPQVPRATRTQSPGDEPSPERTREVLAPAPIGTVPPLPTSASTSTTAEPPGNPQPPWSMAIPPPRSIPNSITVSQSTKGHMWRIGLASVPHARLAVAIDAQAIDAEMGSIRNAFLIALPFALAFIGLAGWFFSARALRPIQRLAETSRRVTADGLSQRIKSKGEDREFVELIEVFNRMLGRLERSFQQATRFSADAAHELKTPLAIVQGQLERTINMAQDGSPMQEALTSILDETRRLSTISRKLLLLSQADAGRLNVYAQPFDLSGALDDLLEDTRMLAPHLKVTGAIQPNLDILADGSLLRQVLHNLISNAIKYNVEPGWIHIATARWAQRVEVLVSNASPGIAKTDREKVFERFYRVDAAHSRHIEGVGLGLSVSREIARAHGGDLLLQADTDGAVNFSLLLPLAGTHKNALG